MKLAESFPEIKFIVQDLPENVEKARKQVPDKFETQLSYSARNFFEPQHTVADCYFFRWIFHDWSDKYARRIVANLLPAMRNGAKLIIMEGVLPPHKAVPLQLERNLRVLDSFMWTFYNGKERELRELIEMVTGVDKRFKFEGLEFPTGSALSVLEFTFVDQDGDKMNATTTTANAPSPIGVHETGYGSTDTAKVAESNETTSDDTKGVHDSSGGITYISEADDVAETANYPTKKLISDASVPADENREDSNVTTRIPNVVEVAGSVSDATRVLASGGASNEVPKEEIETPKVAEPMKTINVGRNIPLTGAAAVPTGNGTKVSTEGVAGGASTTSSGAADAIPKQHTEKAEIAQPQIQV